MDESCSIVVLFPLNRNSARAERARGKKRALRVGFEPTREDPIGFLVQRLNHSAIAALLTCVRIEESLSTGRHAFARRTCSHNQSARILDHRNVIETHVQPMIATRIGHEINLIRL